MSQLSLLPQAHALKDVVYTNDEVAKDIISHFQPSGYLLDPCKGDGAFYNNFPADCKKAYCEIAEGKDFYNFVSKVNWVVGNPPYSIFHEFLKHAFSISENVVFLVPTNKVFQSWKTMSLINKWGGGERCFGLWQRSSHRLSFWLFGGRFPLPKGVQKRSYNHAKTA